jgi:hypothetical protein
MNIVKQSTGNVVLTDNSGNILKVFVQVNALDVVSSNEIIVKYGMNQWTTLFADQIDNTQIEPAAAVPFNGNAYSLVSLLSSSFFFELSGGGGSQNLSQVLTIGNSAGNQDIVDVDKLDFNTATTDTAGVGQLVWNDTLGTLDLGLKGGTTISNVGQHLHARVVNKTSPLVPLTKAGYQVVIVSGATGQRLSVKLAKADNDANSAGTLGIVCENIAVNQEGFIVSVGQLTKINTTGSLQGETWNDGDLLYLSPSTFGAVTNVKPSAPFHEVRVGYVEYAHAINGKIYVKIDNGYELNELHNVDINTGTLANNDIVAYNSSTLVWENKTIATALGYTPAQSEGWTVIIKSANQNVVNSSTLVDDTELQFSVVAGGNYMIQMVLATAGDSSLNDYKFGYAVSAGTMTGSGNAICRNAANSAVVTAINVTGASITNAIPIGQIGNLNGITTGTIDFGFYATNNGIFKFQFALNSGASGTARTCKGTILKFKRLD